MTKTRLATWFATSALMAAPSALVNAQTETEINLNVKHSVSGVSQFDRRKYITLHSTTDSRYWDDIEDKLEYLANDLDVYMGRDNGSMVWHMNQVKQDPTRAGYADPVDIAARGQTNRNKYGAATSRHAFDDKADVMIGGQLSAFWYDHITKPCCGGEPWQVASGQASGEFMGHFLNEFYRNDGEDATQGHPRPRFIEVLNEPLYELVTASDHGSPLEVFEFHNEVAEGIRSVNDTTLIGGYTTAFPIFDERNFARWDERMKLFIDTSGQHMDYFSLHFYDFNQIWSKTAGGYVGPQNYKGGRMEATMDMIQQYSKLTLGEVKPFLISEYGGRDHTLENKGWSPERDWHDLKTINAMTMQYLEMPDQILKSIPFIVDKALWGTNAEGFAYGTRVVRQVKEEEGKTGDEWVFTDLVKFYELWANVKGTRVETRSSNPDVLLDTYVDQNKVYVIVSNLKPGEEKVYLNTFGQQDAQVQSVNIKHLHASAFNTPVLTETNQVSAPSAFDLGSEATAIIEYTFDRDIQINQTADETKYYASSYHQPITANQANTFAIDNVALGQYGDATLRLSFGRNHELSKQPVVTVNGTQIDVPFEYIGDDQRARDQYFGMTELAVPYDLLQEDNNISVTFGDTGGFVTSVTLEVLNFSADVRNKNATVSGAFVAPQQALLTVGKTVGLTASVSPFYATNGNYTFSSSDTAIATVTPEGLVTAVGQGTAYITVTTEEGNFTAQSVITVEEPVAASIKFDDVNTYRNSEYQSGTSMQVSTQYEAGTDQGVNNAGVIYYLRELRSNWSVVKDVVVTDKTVVTQQRGTSTVNIPLDGVTATADLEEGNFYYLFVKFTSTDGVTKTTGVRGINITAAPIVEPEFTFDDVAKYKTTAYQIGETLDVTTHYEAGTGAKISDEVGGIRYFLRELRPNWTVEKDVIVDDASAIGQQSGTSSVSIPLSSVTPTALLADGHFYYLFVRYVDTNGQAKTLSVFPITIEGELVEPSLTLDDASYYYTPFTQNSSITVTTNFEAGAGQTVAASKNGIRYFLREMRANWTVVRDVKVEDTSVIGVQTGVSTVTIPLTGLLPSDQLPEGHFYFLYALFDSTDGTTQRIGGVAPVTIIADFDGDGEADVVDNDDDNDGVIDALDAFPFNAIEWLDTDGDGIGNNADNDDDNDQVLDSADAFPLDATESIDTDGDGVGNNADLDDDGDNVGDLMDAFPLDKNEWLDTDGDGLGNNADADDDNDGVADVLDAFPLDATETIDTDADGIGNNADNDDDNDNVIDSEDLFPLDASESADFDSDGTGDNADNDDDNDGVEDALDHHLGLVSGNVFISGADSGIVNRVNANGVPLAVQISMADTECLANAKNSGQYNSCLSHALNSLKKQGDISGQEKGLLQSIVAKNK
ncbi:hypothetical protein C2869_04310 [Saccharobesus litoralis]|uniref:BIG2 domain-containing protein n=1 Tax=Saccharobesus litoralis TaxID=2172099 RepID=A0A2S0VNG0_9ALTE|nr:Ig-like domain-containing protein [Saccharobesus litoralis]AWB65709.1 hypothetical protein C2869_04310 [Saccharobesus litoralis]